MSMDNLFLQWGSAVDEGMTASPSVVDGVVTR
jgi:hypothetical protein